MNLPPVLDAPVAAAMVTFVALALAPPRPEGAPKAAAEAVLARTRAALGLEIARRLVLSGRATYRGVEAPFRLSFAADGRFVRRIDGPLGDAAGFDGATPWSTDAGGLASAVELEDEEVLKLSNGFVSGHLFRPESGAVFEVADAAAASEVALDARLPGGRRAARVAIDAATALPIRIAIPTVFGGETWSLSDWRAIGPRRVAHRIERRTVADLVDAFRVEHALLPDGPADEAFAPDFSTGAGLFDAAVAPGVEVRRAPTGHLLVHPRVESGKDVGWFIFDSGAGVPVIAPEAADAAGLAALGRTFVGGAGGETPVTRFRAGTRFDLGPLSIAPITYVEMDLAAIGDALGTKVAGVIGFELFRRAVVSVDMAAPSVAIHDPRSFALPADAPAWEPLVLHERHPHVRGRYEAAHEGLFRIDTGAGSAAVVFHSPAVEKRRLLESRETNEVTLGGAGGLSRARMGRVRDFELGGRRLDSIAAIFPSPGSGALDDPYSEGTIGGGIVGGLTLVFDYGRRRIAFLPR